MPKKDNERHTHFISVVFTPPEGRLIESAAKRARIKKSAYIRNAALDRAESERPGRKNK